MPGSSSEIGNVVLSKEYLEKCGSYEIVKIVVSALKTLKPEQMEDVLKYLPVLVTIGEKPITSEEYITLCSKGFIGRPRKDDKCLICLKGTIRKISAGIGGWEISCNKCMFLYDED